MKQDLTKTTYILRILGGGYLAYLGFSMIGSILSATGMMQIVEIGFAGIFMVVGILLCIFSFKGLQALQLQEAEEYDESGENNGQDKE